MVTYNFHTEHRAAAVVKFILKQNNVRVETDFVAHFEPVHVDALVTSLHLKIYVRDYIIFIIIIITIQFVKYQKVENLTS